MLPTHPSPCPNCGYCPCCGRGGRRGSQHPVFGTSSTPESETDDRDDALTRALTDTSVSSRSFDTDRSLTRQAVDG